MNVNMPMSNPPAPSPAGPKPFLQVWIDAVTKPVESTYSELAASPDASAGKAYLWIFLTALISYLVIFVIELLFAAIGLGGRGLGGRGLGGATIGIICLVPIFAGLAVLGFMIVTAIIQWVAKLFKGMGSYNQLAYVFGAFQAPMLLVSSVLSIFYAIPFLGLCLWPISILIFVFIIYMQIAGTKAVNKFGWGEAAGSVLLPGVVVGLICGCVVIGSLMIMGPIIGNVFSSINQSLQGVP